MPPRRRIDPAAGRAALLTWDAARLAAGAGVGADPDAPRDSAAALATCSAVAPAPGVVDADTVALATRYALEELGERAPGRSVEVRVPPYGAVQCIEGTTHRRGTPPAVVEMDPATWLALATGSLTWADAQASGRVRASGQRADLSHLLPLC